MEIYVNDDYAGLETDKYGFYYGYEEVECPVHTDCDEDECDEAEWCFTARKTGGDLLMKIPKSKLNCEDEYSMEKNLLAGIGKFINEYVEV